MIYYSIYVHAQYSALHGLDLWKYSPVCKYFTGRADLMFMIFYLSKLFRCGTGLGRKYVLHKKKLNEEMAALLNIHSRLHGKVAQ